MTDQELIQLLQEKSAGELTPAEVDAIRARWTQSPELRQALVEHLHLESQLTGALAPVRIDVDTILKRASEERRVKSGSSARWAWLLGLAFLLAIGVGIFVIFGARPAQEQIVKNDPVGTPQGVDSASQSIPTADGHEISAEQTVAAANGETPNDRQQPAVSELPSQSPKSAAPDLAANEPWSTTLSREVAPWPANSPKLTADYKSSGHDECPETEAKRWLASVEGQPFNWSTDSVGNPVRRIARFQGLAKLRAPWPDDAVLRMTPFDVADLTLYFWHGPTGVALRFYTRREPHVWAAFEISRENSSPKPTRWGLLTTDNGAYARSIPGMIDIRQQNSELVLARGGIVLLSVPFAGPPIEVFVEGQFRLRGLSMVRSLPFQKPPPNSHRDVLSGPAATLPWAISADSLASFTTNNDGSVSMTVDSPDKTGIVALPFGWLLATGNSPRATGLFEVIVNVESADPGTGIFLGDRNARPLHQVGFFRDAASQQITFGLLRPGEQRSDANFNRDDYAPPYLAKAGWLKLISGLGTIHVQTSGDGVHWGHVVENPGRDWPGAVGSMGLFGLQGPNARTIRIRQVQIRELTGITDLADQPLRQQVKPFRNEEMRNLAAWSHQVLETLPDGVDPSTWFTANVVATLSQGPPRDLGLALLRELITAQMQSNLSFERKRQMLDDACSLTDLFDDAAAKTMGVFYEQLGWQLAQSGDADPLAKLRPAWLWSPIWTFSKMRYVWERLHSHQILQAVYQSDWSAVWILSQSASYWNLFPNPDQRPTERGEDLDRHARWAKTLVAEYQPQLDDGTAGVMPQAIRHPLIPVLNKEGYNVRAELQSALAGQTYDDACRIVMSIATHEGPGLLPDVEDRNLYVSMPTAIATAHKAHPGFAATMSTKFEPLGLIRVRSAINRQDLAGLQATTLQFMGTDAAREAHAWLGDMALAAGQFEVAEQHFRDALIDAGLSRRESLEPRLLLSRALGGQLSTTELTTTIGRTPLRALEFNGTTIAASELESVLKDLMARPPMAGLTKESPRPPEREFAQSAFKLEPRAQFDGHPGNNPGRGEYRFGDPYGRQLSVATDDQKIYVSNRFQVNAYALTMGQQVWAQGLGSEQGESYALAFTPMKPLIAGDRLFIRRLTKAGAELACLNKNDGQVVWHQRPTHSVLTDPFIWNGRLFAVILSKIDDELAQVEVAWFDPASGAVTASRPLFRLRDAADRQISGQLTISDRLAVCTVAGTAASFDSQGEIRWLRRFTLMQKPVDEQAEDFRIAAPAVRGDKVIISIPGVREISCLDLATGRSIWERPIPNLRGMAAVTDSRVLIDTVDGVVALDTESGEISWRYAVESRLEAMSVHGSNLVISRRAANQHNLSRPLLIWLDAQSGEERAQTLVDVAEREEFQLGPMFSAGGKWWSFVGQTWREPKRELHELVSTSAPSPRSFTNETLLGWSPRILDSQLSEIEAVVPGWFPVADYRERLVLHSGELRGETFLLVGKMDIYHELMFTNRVNFVAGRKHTLRLRVGNQPGQKWKLTICASTRVLLQREIEDAGSQNGWRDVTVDLSGLAGQTTSLRLIQSAINNASAESLWKRAELIVE